MSQYKVFLPYQESRLAVNKQKDKRCLRKLLILLQKILSSPEVKIDLFLLFPAPLSVLTGLSITQNVTCVESNSTLNHPLSKHIASKQIFGFYGAGQFDFSKLEILIFLAISPKTFKTLRRGLLVAKSDFS